MHIFVEIGIISQQSAQNVRWQGRNDTTNLSLVPYHLELYIAVVDFQGQYYTCYL